MHEAKTNAVRIVETAKIDHEVTTYGGTEPLDGVSVAGKLGVDVEYVFKTLVTQGKSGGYFVFVVPAAEELDLKKAARASGEKSIEMIPVKDINKVTGYVRGGCSPVGMSKHFPTYFAEEVILVDTMICSAGKVGHQVEVAPDALIALVDGQVADLTVQ